MKKLLFALLAVAVSPPVFAQESGTITSTQCIAIDVKVDKSTVGIQVTGTWSGTLQPQVSIQGQPAANTQVVPSTSTTPQATITGNGVFYANVGGGGIFQVCGNTVSSGTANIFLNGSKGVNASTLGGGGAGSGTVTNSGNLVNNNLLLGAGATSIKDYGSSFLAPANGGVLNVNTADTGYFITGNSAPFLGSSGGFGATQPTGTTTEVRCYQFVLPHAITIGKMTWTVGTAAGNMSFGIYSADGNTKLVDSGVVTLVGATAAQTVTITPVTLNPGTYIFAWTSTNTAARVFQQALATSGDLMMNVQTIKKMGTATVSVAGALNATLGAISAAAVSSPVLLLER